MANLTIPDEFICPITMNVMVDPVVGTDGHTYERTAITEWLLQSGLNQSPMTREPMTVDQLRPNYALRTSIEKWHQDNGAVPQANASRPLTDGEGEVLVLAILDTSGSMGESATNVQDAEGLNFSRLDLVKHSMRTVAAMLNQKDNTYMGILKFSTSCKRIMRPTLMNSYGLKMATQAIDSLYPEGSTNVWDGLRLALEDIQTVRKHKPKIRVEMILLTDGEPTASLSPPMGIVQTFSRALPDSTGIVLSTFGFGYNLDTKLLGDLCEKGSGIYGYIPDCSMVATVFINYCSHILAKEKVKVDYEQEEIMRKVAEELKGISRVGMEQLQNLKEFLLAKKADLFLQDLESDDPNKGQLMKAISNEGWYRSWGKNHLLSYRRALEQKVCINFKDAVVQLFKTPEFEQIQEKGNDLFAALPAPVPRGHTRESFQATGFTMNTFNTADGGCFLGRCLVEMRDGSKKRVDEIKKGDVLSNNSVVICVVERIMNRVIKLVKLPGGLVITPWHPIRIYGAKWMFPCMYMLKVDKLYVDKVYDFVLAGEGIAIIDKVEVATLGHGFTTDEVIRHDYYGTGAVIQDLMKYPGWDTGRVYIDDTLVKY
jgi:Mg-chelatase subunit ChlD